MTVHFLELFKLLQRSFWRDRAAVLWTFLFPLFLLAVLGGLFAHPPRPFATVAIADSDGGAVAREIRTRIEQSGWAAPPGLPADAVLAIPPGTSGRVAAGQVTRFAATYRSVDRDQSLAIHALLSSQLLQMNQAIAPNAVLLQLASPPRVARPRAAANRYSDFLLWGLVGLNVLSTALFGVGVGSAWFREEGVLRRLWLTPARPSVYLGAQLVHIALLLSASTGLLMAAGHWVFSTPWPPLLPALAVLGMGAFALVPLGLAIAARTARPQTTQMCANLLYFPLMLLSGVYFRPEAIGERVSAVMAWLPLKPFVDSLRAVSEGASLASLGPEFATMTAYGLGGAALARGLFRWNA